MFEVSCMACAAVIFGWLGSRDIRRCSSVWHWRRLLQWIPIRGLGAALLLLLLVVFSTPATNVALALSSALSITEHQVGADEFADGSRATLHERST
jgi:hypothetical protein